MEDNGLADSSTTSESSVLSPSSTDRTVELLPEAPMQEFGLGTGVDVTGCEVPASTTYFGLTESLVPQI